MSVIAAASFSCFLLCLCPSSFLVCSVMSCINSTERVNDFGYVCISNTQTCLNNRVHFISWVHYWNQADA
ncbi:hypothetical protein Lalb_Chr20g0112491 [Lupinus albus]|uniref:Secreted protein n=1 Tax=Lupinus albus TaxID=3870 RepID=A0A6A4NPS4_LUPAL|nr:hypothetical protein Lalb_Chr20g0112491 [Lupinus albus]